MRAMTDCERIALYTLHDEIQFQEKMLEQYKTDGSPRNLIGFTDFDITIYRHEAIITVLKRLYFALERRFSLYNDNKDNINIVPADFHPSSIQGSGT